MVEFLVLTFFMVLFRLVIVLETPIFFCLKDVLLEVATQIVGVSLYAYANNSLYNAVHLLPDSELPPKFLSAAAENAATDEIVHF